MKYSHKSQKPPPKAPGTVPHNSVDSQEGNRKDFLGYYGYLKPSTGEGFTGHMQLLARLFVSVFEIWFLHIAEVSLELTT